MLALLLGCGLRRAELVGLKVGDSADSRGPLVIADLIGKGKHIRTVPVPFWVKTIIDEWIGVSAIKTESSFELLIAMMRCGESG